MDKVLDIAVFSIWITVFAVLMPKACDAEVLIPLRTGKSYNGELR